MTGSIIGIKEESRIGVIQTLWNYIKLQGLQDKVDRRLIRADERLRSVCHFFLPPEALVIFFDQIFGTETIVFQKLPDIVNRYLVAPDPIILHYTVNPGLPPPERPSAWDVEIKMEDTSMKNRMAVTVSASKESMQTLLKIDEEVRVSMFFSVASFVVNFGPLQIALLAQSLHNSHMKRTFLESFAHDPSQFIQTWLESQSRDLESILGSGPTEGATVRQEELKRSEFFQLPWVEEVCVLSCRCRLITDTGSSGGTAGCCHSGRSASGWEKYGIVALIPFPLLFLVLYCCTFSIVIYWSA